MIRNAALVCCAITSARHHRSSSCAAEERQRDAKRYLSIQALEWRHAKSCSIIREPRSCRISNRYRSFPQLILLRHSMLNSPRRAEAAVRTAINLFNAPRPQSSKFDGTFCQQKLAEKPPKWQVSHRFAMRLAQ